ncbi:MAG: hypothetical protein U1F53_01760 [Burkholderiaceae bacterium]
MDAVLADSVPSTSQRFALRFQSLFNQGRAMVFPCDARGQVNLDTLSERARENYFYARAVIGFEYAEPAVMRDYSAA